MNIQVFARNKCFDSKKTQRYFKERNIKISYLDLGERKISKGELSSLVQALGNIDKLVDEKAKNQKAYLQYKYCTEGNKFSFLLENQDILKTPIVRSKNKAVVGYNPKEWEKWGE